MKWVFVSALIFAGMIVGYIIRGMVEDIIYWNERKKKRLQKIVDSQKEIQRIMIKRGRS